MSHLPCPGLCGKFKGLFYIPCKNVCVVLGEFMPAGFSSDDIRNCQVGAFWKPVA